MRLTLRTLLAYLDDCLEPAETKLIGQKIQESAVAGKLISLIRLVVRQRRLKAPSVSGPNVGIDPNVVAQYLDSKLPENQYVEVEKVLLTSDELLAEVASCHQVLALVVGKPVEVSAASRERLYALGPVSQSEQLRVEEPAATDAALAAASTRDAERVNGSPRPAVQTPPEIPEYLRQKSFSQRFVPAAVVALLVLVCGSVLYFDPSLGAVFRQFRSELSKGERDSGKNTATIVADSGAAAKDTEVPDASKQIASLKLDGLTETSMQVGDAVPPGPADAGSLPDGSDFSKVGSKVKASVPMIAASGAEAPADSTGSSRKETAPAPGTPIPNPPPVGNDQPVAVKTAPHVLYVSTEGMALRFDESKEHWFLLPKRSQVTPGELLAIPEPFEAQLDFDSGTIVATVIGGSNVRLLNPNRVTGSGFGINRAQILLRSSHKELTTNYGLSIVVGNDTWLLEFLAPDTVCAIDVAPREPVQLDKPYDQNWYTGVLRVLSGSVKWTTADGQSQQIAAQYALGIESQGPAAGPKPSPISSPYNPDWTDTQKRKQAQFPLRQKAPVFEKQFDPNQPVEQTLLSLIRDPHAKVSELAIRSLSLIDDYAALVQALAECEYEEGRFAARDGIRAWLGRQADRGELLKAALEMHFPPSEASAAYVLLWGFRPDDGSNKNASVELVMWLRSTHVAIRELSYYWITHLSNRKWEYRAVDVVARREAAVRKIEAHVLKDGALVKPGSKDPPTPKPE